MKAERRMMNPRPVKPEPDNTGGGRCKLANSLQKKGVLFLI